MSEFSVVNPVIATVVIPVYNGENYLKQSLPQLRSSMPNNVGLVVVDDGSTDCSYEIAKKYANHVIRIEENKGHPFARNCGLEKVQGDIYIALDADVLIEKDSIQKILDTFNEYPDVTAVTGMLSDKEIEEHFFSDYKNLYMNFTFRNCSDEVDFLYGSIHAVRIKEMLPYALDVGRTDDTDLGMRLALKGKKNLLLKKLQVKHLKIYDFISLLKNDFFIPYDWTKVFLKHFSVKGMIKQKGFAHSKFQQLLSVCVAFLTYLSAWISIFSQYHSKMNDSSGEMIRLTTLVLGVLWFILNFKFFQYLNQKRNLVFTVKAVFFTFIDQNVMFIGIFSGFLINGMKKISNQILPAPGEFSNRRV